jgi:hypothetical protein
MTLFTISQKICPAASVDDLKVTKILITAIFILFFRDISQKKEVSSVSFLFMLLCPAT